MKLVPVIVATPVLGLALSFAFAQEPDGGLRRVQPLDPGSAQATRESEPFRAEEWREALSATDLDRRERDFDRLVRLARQDADAADFLRELSADASAPELAWTARLALRELGSGQAPGFFRPFAGPGVRLSDPFSDLSELLEQMQGGVFGMPGGLHGLHLHGMPQGGASQERQIRIEHDGQEWRVFVTERKDGEESTREFSGPSIDAILEANPELADELGVFHLGDAEGFRMDTPPGGPLGAMLEGLDGFRRLQPSQGFEFRGPDGTPRQLRFFLGPQGQSRPVRTDVLGVRVSPVTQDLADQLGLAQPGGLYVFDSFPGTIAHLLGVKSGDVLLELDGIPLTSADDITRHMRERPEGELHLTWIDSAGDRLERTWTPEPKAETREF